MKSVSFQSSTYWFLCAFELSFFFLISDVMYFTVIFYEGGGQFPIINTGSICAFELSFFIMISDVTYYSVICYEDG